MNITETKSIEKINGKMYNLKLYEPYTEKSAAFTHYLQTFKRPEAKYFQKTALRYLKEYLVINNSGQIITNKIAETALQQIIFNFKKDVPFPPPVNPKFTFIDLFAGIGGFRIALQKLKGKCVYSSEWDKNAKITYNANFGEIPFGDITSKTTKAFIPKNFDVLCAGFPCQSFSIAGYQKGFSDTRGTLFFDIEKIAEIHRPKVVFLENVKNLVNHDSRNTFKVILDVLENKLKYKVFHKVLNSMEYANIPQNRERIFFVAFDPNQVENYSKFLFPKKIKLTKTIHDIIENNKKEEIFYYNKDHLYYDKLKETIKSKDSVYQWRRVYVRENKSNVCPTLTANMGTGGHNVPLIKVKHGIRKLTPRECFSFQGFPDRYVLPKIANSKLYMQAGNSVTLPLIERIARKIIKVL